MEAEQGTHVLSRCPELRRHLRTVDDHHRTNEAGRLDSDPRVGLRPREDYAARGPLPADVLLAADVSDTTLRTDRRVKPALHARAGIPEFWIVNVAAKAVELDRSAAGDACGWTERQGTGGTAGMAALPDVRIPVNQIFR